MSSSLFKKSGALPPLPTKLDEVLSVENYRASTRTDHATISVRYEAPSGRGGEFPVDRFSLSVHGGDNGFVTLRGGCPSLLPGIPSGSTDRLDLTLPIDMLLPLLIGIERAAQMLVPHEREAERALARRGDISEQLAHGWSWF